MLDSPPKGIAYDSLKSSFLVWLTQLGSALWASIQAEYLTDDILDSMKDSLDELVLETIDLPLCQN